MKLVLNFVIFNHLDLFRISDFEFGIYSFVYVTFVPSVVNSRRILLRPTSCRGSAARRRSRHARAWPFWCGDR